MKICPYCSEEIKDEAIKCKHCREWLDTNVKKIVQNEDMYILRRSSGFKREDYSATYEILTKWFKEKKIKPEDQIWDPNLKSWSYAKYSEVMIDISLAAPKKEGKEKSQCKYILRKYYGGKKNDWEADKETLKQWFKDNKIQPNDQIYNPATDQWSVAKDLFFFKKSLIDNHFGFKENTHVMEKLFKIMAAIFVIIIAGLLVSALRLGCKNMF